MNYVKVQCATYTLTIQSLLDGYQKSSDGTIIVADEGVIIASNDRSLIDQNSTEQEAIQQLKKNADSKHMMHLKAGDVFSFGIMLKQRDHYIYAYVPDTVIFQTLPQNVIACMFIYLSGCTGRNMAGCQQVKGRKPEKGTGKRRGEENSFHGQKRCKYNIDYCNDCKCTPKKIYVDFMYFL